jgi:hypothetical protein
VTARFISVTSLITTVSAMQGTPLDEPRSGNTFGDAFWGPTGWEELRKLIKTGSEFCKDIAAVLQERVDIEHVYAKSLAKVASKMTKLCKEAHTGPKCVIDGTMGKGGKGWQGVAYVSPRPAKPNH